MKTKNKAGNSRDLD